MPVEGKPETEGLQAESSQHSNTNRLIDEKSPYLLQHAHNPVDWYPWGDEAFAKAKREDKLLLLSIGYATCHWCHVMERESFEDQQTADLLNKNFVSIKVDREERPDLDQIYLNALHLTGQQGGWPLNMFLTADRLPITGGTYFPPQPLYGRPSFRQLLQALSDAWQNDRQKLLQSANTLYSYLQREGWKEESQPSAGELPGIEALHPAFQQYLGAYDSQRGGFLNNGSNKFPPSLSLLFLLTYYRQFREATALEMVENSLEHIKRGGIYDQIGGGLSRYSTDHEWRVPHFEKMLYDNALFALVLAETFRITGKSRYRRWAFDLFAYIERDMTSPEGAFYSAEDADSEGEEGRFYLWSWDEMETILKQAGLAAEERQKIYSFWQVSAAGNFEGRNILYESKRREQFLKELPEERGNREEGSIGEGNTGESNREEGSIGEGSTEEGSIGEGSTEEGNTNREEGNFEEANSEESSKNKSWERLLARARQALFETRSRRIRPLLDDKVLTSWNALMISALSVGAAAFSSPLLAARARRAADFLWKKNYSQKEGQPGQLQRRYRQQEARFAGTLADYSSFGSALLDLYRVDFRPQHIERAVKLAEAILSRFSREGGAFYNTEEGAQDLIVRTIDAYDGVEPSGNAMAARLFHTLALYGIERQRYLNAAKGIWSYFASSLRENGTGHPFLLHTLTSYLSPPPEIAVVAPLILKSNGESEKSKNEESESKKSESEKNKRQLTEIQNWIMSRLSLETALAFAEEDEIDKAAAIIPLLAGRKALQGKETIFLCRQLSCKKPLHNLNELQELLANDSYALSSY